jgi:hypothetical protein
MPNGIDNDSVIQNSRGTENSIFDVYVLFLLDSYLLPAEKFCFLNSGLFKQMIKLFSMS